jgi:UDP-N-acetyl-D-glucosamine dehydrogenase
MTATINRQTPGTVGVVGLGYTGLPLALSLAGAGLLTIGLDIDQDKISALGHGRSYLPDVDDDELAATADWFEPTSDAGRLAGLDAYVICVPTPTADGGFADLSYVDAAVDTVAPLVGKGSLVVLQSTVPPGTTAKLAARLARGSGLVPGVDFHVAMAPERIDPASAGGGGWTVRNTPKLVGGLTPECTRLAVWLMQHVTSTVVPVSKPEVAEIAKVFENTFRLVNIALVYELSGLCEALGLAPREVIDAAATKPYGFLPHYPGPGVGGECIPVDPQFLTALGQEHGRPMRLVELAHQHVRTRPSVVVDRLAGLLKDEESDLSGARVLVAGAAYKPGVADTRNSPAIDIIRELRNRAAKPSYADPLVTDLVVDGEAVERIDWHGDHVSEFDCVVLVTPHAELVGQPPLWDVAPLVLDTWHLLPAGDGVHHL